MAKLSLGIGKMLLGQSGGIDHMATFGFKSEITRIPTEAEEGPEGTASYRGVVDSGYSCGRGTPP